MLKQSSYNKLITLSAGFTLCLLLLPPVSAQIISRVVNTSVGKQYVADVECIASEKINISVGEEFCGSGYFESPNIEIRTKKFAFTGTIKCDEKCTIRSEIPFDHAMFKRQGKGEFIFIVEPLDSSENKTPIQSASENNKPEDCSYLELALKYRDGEGVAQDKKKAADYFALAAEQGSDFARTQLGIYYCEGVGVEKDSQKGIALLSQAAEKEDAGALNYLGYCYLNGDGVKKDAKKAFDLFLKSAEKGNIDSMQCVAQCYCYGCGVAKNKDTANEWNEKPSFKDMTSQQRELFWEIWNDINFSHKK